MHNYPYLFYIVRLKPKIQKLNQVILDAQFITATLSGADVNAKYSRIFSHTN